MNEIAKIKFPVMMNCWKHHARFILEQIQNLKSESEPVELRNRLLLIGRSQMDLYIGKYSPGVISEKIIENLRKKKLITYALYNSWLNADGSGYKLISLPDKSEWILRPGNDFQRYVHIHPARYSANTIRVKATTLKTAICILAFQKFHPSEAIEISIVNNLRNKFINEPPIKSLKKNSGLEKLLKLFSKL